MDETRTQHAVLRVNSAGVLAKLGSTRLDDEVIRTLKSDLDTRQLYLTAVTSRVLELPWTEAAALAANAEQRRDWHAQYVDRAAHFTGRLTAELTNPHDGAARWCSIVLLDQLRSLDPATSSNALHTALHHEADAENLRSIGAALSGDNPISS